MICRGLELGPVIHIPECEKHEVDTIIFYLYTGRFKRPNSSDWRAWLYLLNAACKFEMMCLIKLAIKGVKDAITKPETFAEVLHEASQLPLQFGTKFMVLSFGSLREKPKMKFLTMLKSRKILNKHLLKILLELDSMTETMFDNLVMCTLTDEKACRICYKMLASPLHILIPCAHSVICGSCVAAIRARNDKCPICRVQIKNVQHVGLDILDGLP